MITITTTTTLQAVLGGAPAATQPTYHVDYIDTADDAVGQGAGSLNSTTDVDIVAAPATGDRLIRQIHLHNADSGSVTVTVKTDTSGTERKLIIATLTTGQSLIYNSNSGWIVGTLTATGTYQPIDATLTAIAAYNTNGLLAQTAADTFAGRTLTGTANKVDVSNGDGVSGNPTVTLSATLDLGGNTSVEIPNGAGGTTVDAAGEVCIDSTSRTLNFYDGTAEVVLNPMRQASMFLYAPVATDDLPILRFDVAVTLVKTVYAIAGTTNWVGQVQEADDAQGTGAADTQAADSTVTGTTTVTSYTNAIFDAGDYAFLKTTSISGTPTWLHVTIYWRENA